MSLFEPANTSGCEVVTIVIDSQLCEQCDWKVGTCNMGICKVLCWLIVLLNYYARYYKLGKLEIILSNFNEKNRVIEKFRIQ